MIIDFNASGSSHRRFKFIENLMRVPKVVLLRRVAHNRVFRLVDLIELLTSLSFLAFGFHVTIAGCSIQGK